MRVLNGSLRLTLLNAFHPQVAEGHRTVVTLQHDRSQGFFVRPMGAARWTFQLNVLLDTLSVM